MGLCQGGATDTFLVDLRDGFDFEQQINTSSLFHI